MNIQLQEEILNLGSDSLHVFGGRFEGGIHLQQSIEEITGLIEFLIQQNKKYENFLEVGAAAGGNTYLFNKFFNFEKIFIIDDNQHKKNTIRKETLKDINYQEYIGDSQSIEAKQFIENQKLLFDIIFIDADHSYAGVTNDINNYRSFLKPGGFLIFHDTICCDGVACATNELKSSEDFEFIKEFSSNSGHRLGLGLFKKK